ncbi:MAG: methionyl-tRNA formyltransferase [Deltaproteobacteria bacterium RBG_13_49_15]|nr:MAG: methionyl-tRNA formyltransferase [Deltaproteobacteria bacterium RBG_13_49_15]
MGTPDFAVPSLRGLHKSGHQISYVVTQPDRPKGRGCRLKPSAVKSAALELGLPVLQPCSMQEPDLIKNLSGVNPDLFVVVAFGYILPRNLLKIPGSGSVNIHASLLPKYRGPAPIQWVIINQEKETGITAIRMDEGMDTGDILHFSRTTLSMNETVETLYDRLARMGADVLLETINKMEQGDLSVNPQDHSKATYAPMLKKSDGRIDWKLPAEKIEAFIRGVAQWPGAFAFIGKERIKMFLARVEPLDPPEPAGTILRASQGELWVATGKGALSILEIQAESGKRLFINDFLRGNKIPEGIVLS